MMRDRLCRRIVVPAPRAVCSLAQYWLLKEKFLGSESGSGAAADMVNQEGWMTMTGIHTHTTYAAMTIRNTD